MVCSAGSYASLALCAQLQQCARSLRAPSTRCFRRPSWPELPRTRPHGHGAQSRALVTSPSTSTSSSSSAAAVPGVPVHSSPQARRASAADSTPAASCLQKPSAGKGEVSSLHEPAGRRSAPRQPTVADGPSRWLDAVAAGVRAFDESLRPSQIQIDEHERLLQLLTDLVLPLGGQLRCYGSVMTGLRTSTSDLDVTWLRPTPPQRGSAEASRRWAIRQLRALLEAVATAGGGTATIVRVRGGEVAECGPTLVAAGVQRSRIIFASRRHGAPPVLKLENGHGDAVCDVTLNNWEGLRNTALLLAFGRAQPSFVVLGRVVKHWARTCGVLDRRRGRLSTFGLMLMLAGALQKHGALLSPQVVSTICERLVEAGHEDLAGASVDQALATLVAQLDCSTIAHDAKGESSDGVTKENVGQLFLLFFQTYGHRHDCLGIDLADSGVATAVTEVRCPLTGVDIEAQLTRRHWRFSMFPEFSRALKAFSRARAEFEQPAGDGNTSASTAALDVKALLAAACTKQPTPGSTFGNSRKAIPKGTEAQPLDPLPPQPQPQRQRRQRPPPPSAALPLQQGSEGRHACPDVRESQ